MNYAWILGLLTGLALIVAIGAQNALVVRQGIRRQHVGAVVLICVVSDAVLIAAGTAGIGFLVERVPWLLEAFRWAGVLYLVGFSVRSLWSAAKPQALDAAEDVGGSLRSVTLTTLALTWLNPHVYVDTVIVLGNVANQQGDQRWAFAGGALTGSLLWFVFLGVSAHALSRVLNRPRTWRIIDVLVGVVMLVIAVNLAVTPVI